MELPRIAGDSAAHCVADESEEAREPSTTCNGGLEELTTMVVVSVVYLYKCSELIDPSRAAPTISMLDVVLMA